MRRIRVTSFHPAAEHSPGHSEIFGGCECWRVHRHQVCEIPVCNNMCVLVCVVWPCKNMQHLIQNSMIQGKDRDATGRPLPKSPQFMTAFISFTYWDEASLHHCDQAQADMQVSISCKASAACQCYLWSLACTQHPQVNMLGNANLCVCY